MKMKLTEYIKSRKHLITKPSTARRHLREIEGILPDNDQIERQIEQTGKGAYIKMIVESGMPNTFCDPEKQDPDFNKGKKNEFYTTFQRAIDRKDFHRAFGWRDIK